MLNHWSQTRPFAFRMPSICINYVLCCLNTKYWVIAQGGVMKSIIIFLSLCFSLSIFAGIPRTPNPEIAPGALCTTEDSDFHEYRYAERIVYCKRKVSKRLKNELYRIYGIPLKCKGAYTIDHIIPLSIGGNNRAENLWPEHKSIKRTRQNLEYDLYLALRKASITQEFAVNTILEEKFNPNIPLSKKKRKSSCPRLVPMLASDY